MSIDDQRRVTIRASAGLCGLDRTTVLSWLTSETPAPPSPSRHDGLLLRRRGDRIVDRLGRSHGDSDLWSLQVDWRRGMLPHCGIVENRVTGFLMCKGRRKLYTFGLWALASQDQIKDS
jgi:hypothetical protein